MSDLERSPLLQIPHLTPLHVVYCLGAKPQPISTIRAFYRHDPEVLQKQILRIDDTGVCKCYLCMRACNVCPGLFTGVYVYLLLGMCLLLMCGCVFLPIHVCAC